jgi:hypothetical protein
MFMSSWKLQLTILLVTFWRMNENTVWYSFKSLRSGVKSKIVLVSYVILDTEIYFVNQSFIKEK